MDKNLINLFCDLSKSVNIITKEQLESFIRPIFEKIVKSLGIAFYEIQEASYTDGKLDIVLKTLWATNNFTGGTETLHRDEYGGYSSERPDLGYGQVAYAFTNNTSLWITGKNKDLLRGTQDYVDLWNEASTSKIPIFGAANEDVNHHKTKTSIIILIRNAGNRVPIGVMNFEIEKYLIPSKKYKKNLEELAKAISTFLQLSDSREQQKNNTESILRKIQQKPIEELTPLEDLLGKPQVFIAYSGMCDNNVLDCIKECLKKYEEAGKFDVQYWKDEHKRENIDQYILNTIKTSRYGIVYFSEKSETGYTDNPNVLFEAGMFHALVNDRDEDTLTKDWILIRERKSMEKTPFDFAHERIIWVERNGKGAIKKQAFLDDLTKTIEKLKEFND